MKIYDVISEGPEYTTPGGIVIPSGAKTGPAMADTSKYEKKPYEKVVKKDTPKPELKKKAAGVVGKAAKAGASKFGGLIKDWLLRNKIDNVALETKAAKAAGVWFRLIQLFNCVPFAIQYWESKTAIEGLVAEKKLTPEDASAAQRLEIERLAIEIASSSIFFNFIRKLMTAIKIGRFASVAVGVAVSGLTLGLLGAVAVAEILATEYVALKLQEWLQSPEGQQILTYCILNMIDPTIVELRNMGPEALTGKIKAISAEGEKAYKGTVAPKGDPSKSNIIPEPAKKAAAAAAGAVGGAVDAAKKAYDNWGTDAVPTQWVNADNDAARYVKPVRATPDSQVYTPSGFRRTPSGALIMDPTAVK